MGTRERKGIWRLGLEGAVSDFKNKTQNRNKTKQKKQKTLNLKLLKK